jgi:ABC-2 type transport system ATP-binding protein
MNILSATSITKRFANHTALTKVNIEVPEGSIYGLLGPNGAGKTTFIRIITQIIAPDEGEIFIKVTDCHRNMRVSSDTCPKKEACTKK